MNWDLGRGHWYSGTWIQTNLFPPQMNLIYLFFFGVALYQYRHRIPTGPWAVLAALAVLVMSFVQQDWYLCGSTAAAYLCLTAVVRLRWQIVPPLANLSFGVYVWAFPLGQLAVLAGLNRTPHFVFATCCLVAATVAAAASHALVEKPVERLAKRWKTGWAQPARSPSIL